MTTPSSSPTHRPQRIYRTSHVSRERNRMHARKTRQRKKEHMQKLQGRADELKQEQIHLKQAINEKNTANILVGIFQNSGGGSSSDDADNDTTNPEVEILLKRSVDDIPDASKIPELPALILPGQHTGKRKSSSTTDNESDCDNKEVPKEEQLEGIDYNLLSKDRSSCTPAELDQIRRERNRMHAKRTRDRKRIFMEEMEVMIKQLESENAILLEHATKINAYIPSAEEEAEQFPQPITPELAPMVAPSFTTAPHGAAPMSSQQSYQEVNDPTYDSAQSKGDFVNQIESLLAAAGSFQKRRGISEVNISSISCAESDVTTSTTGDEDDDNLLRPNKRQCISSVGTSSNDLPTSVPKSITTTNYSR